ncbi:hypothetical protein PHMEG_00027854 [Phytophthora megakarya]|uniref:Uncharacterized protein n=1 Tax=Phytophthora megakarya TaxID=4795 RepID=A0A225V695_9STRA|nr:hypothetical protein PHMEG_00027854 [Phytophthora megakarya]
MNFAYPAPPQWCAVPRSSGDSGFHRESQEEVQVKTEQRNEMSSDARSSTASLNARCADRQSARRNSVNGSEADLDPDPDPEEKPHPPQVSGMKTPDPVMRILKLKRIADPKEPVTAPATLANRFDAVMKLIRLLKEAGMAPESFDADALFGLDLNVIQATSRDLFQKLKILAGEIPSR